MFEIDGKVFRNIQEQVQKNKSDIAALRNVETVLNEFGITVLGRVDTETEIPEGTYQYGDAYLVGTEEPYDMYIFTRDDADGEFVNIGPINITGPQGPKGDTGETGPKGDTGATGATGNGIYTITKTATVGNVDTYTISYTDGTSTTFNVTNGINGQNGADGDPGESFMIMGTISSTSLLPDPSTTPRNHAYVLNDGVSTTPDRLYYITGAVGSEVWSYSPLAAAGTTITVSGNPVYSFNADTKQNVLTQSIVPSGDPYSILGFDSNGNLTQGSDRYNQFSVRFDSGISLPFADGAMDPTLAGRVAQYLSSFTNRDRLHYIIFADGSASGITGGVPSCAFRFEGIKAINNVEYYLLTTVIEPSTVPILQVMLIDVNGTAGTITSYNLDASAYSYTNVSFATKAEFSTFMKNNFRQIHSISFKPTNALNVAIGAIQVGDSNGVKAGTASVQALQWDLIPNDKATTLILEGWVDAATAGEYTFRWVFAPIAWGSSVRVEHSSSSGTMTASGLICNGSVSAQYIGGIAQRQEIQNYLLNTTITVKHLGALTL